MCDWVYLFCSQCLSGLDKLLQRPFKCVFLGYYHFKKGIKLFSVNKKVLCWLISPSLRTHLVLNGTFFICSTSPSYTILWYSLIIPTSSQNPTQSANNILSPPLLTYQHHAQIIPSPCLKILMTQILHHQIELVRNTERGGWIVFLEIFFSTYIWQPLINIGWSSWVANPLTRKTLSWHKRL